MLSVLFVCVGNVCRSPLAERLLVHRLDGHGVAGAFRVSSVGVHARRGQRMHPHSVEGLEALGGSAEGFRSTPLTEPVVRDAGLVLTATRDLREQVLGEVPAALRRSFTILELAALATRGDRVLDPDVPVADLIAWCATRRADVSAEELDVPDPMSRSRAVFDDVAVRLDGAVTTIAATLARHAAAPARP